MFLIILEPQIEYPEKKNAERNVEKTGPLRHKIVVKVSYQKEKKISRASHGIFTRNNRTLH